MNSNFMRAASKCSKQTLLTRSWKRSLMLALVTLNVCIQCVCRTGRASGKSTDVPSQWVD